MIGAVIILGALFAAVFLGTRIRRTLPEHHLSADTRDAVKLSIGLVATMSALLLGLLLSAAKSGYDAQRNQLLQIAAKAALLDRTLEFYGPEAAEVRVRFHAVTEDAIRHIWPEREGVAPMLQPDSRGGDLVFTGIQQLAPKDDLQRSLKNESARLAMDIGQLRSLLVAQSAATISPALLVIVAFWLVTIFLGFSVLAPPNATASAALIVSALSVGGAFFLIMELDTPLSGVLKISSAPMVNALNFAPK